MLLFSIMISFVNRELVFAVDSISHPWFNFQRWFLVLEWLSFRWRFMYKHWHCVFDDSMRHTWIYFCYRFYESLVNSLMQSTPYVSCHSYFSGDLKVYSDSVFDDDLCISSGIVCLTIPCVTHESIFAIGFMRRSWVLWRCRLYPLAVTHTSVAISMSLVTLFSLTISGR